MSKRAYDSPIEHVISSGSFWSHPNLDNKRRKDESYSDSIDVNVTDESIDVGITYKCNKWAVRYYMKCNNYMYCRW